MSTTKVIFIKIGKYIGTTIIALLAFMCIAPLIFEDKFNEEIKKVANQKLNAKLDYSKSNISFFTHFSSLTVSLENFSLNGSKPLIMKN